MRHLIWDTSRGLERETAQKTGIAVLIGSVALTAVTLFVI
ncbi:MAG: hypothetical protein ABGW81_07785 [Paracoccaceae bacterium]